jgi:hypothetical protein
MKRKKRTYKTHKSFFNKIFNNQIVIKILSGLVIALTSYFINHLQTSHTINQLQKDNTDLDWAVDYYRK